MRRLKLGSLSALLATLVSALAFTFVPPPALSQNVNGRYDNIAWTTTYAAGQVVLAPIPNATIQVCTYPANAVPCTNLATLYIGPSVLGGTAPNPTTTDAYGNFGFWAAIGYYQYTLTNSLGQSVGPYPIVVSNASSGSGGGAAFPPTTGLVVNTTTTTATTATSAQVANTLNTTPSTQLAPALLPAATLSALGAVRPDGSTITISGSGVISSTSSGATIPGTTLILKGTGSVGASAAASPGIDYVVPSGNITGSAASLSGSSAIPNGSVATTQSPGDNTLKLATDAFVLSNALTPSSIPSTAQVLKGSGTAGSAAVATPNTDYLTPTFWSTLTGCTTSGYTYSPQSGTCIPSSGGTIPATSLILKGSGSAGVSVPATPGADFITPVPTTTTQNIYQTGGSQLGVSALNGDYWQSGYPTGGCTVSSVVYTTQLECAWASVVAIALANSSMPTLHLNPGYSTINAPLALPVQSFTSVSLVGPAPGTQGAIIVANPASTWTDAMIIKNETGGGGTLPTASFRDFKMIASDKALGCMRLWGLQVPIVENLNCDNVPGGATGNAPYLYEFSEPSNYGQGWIFGMTLKNVFGGDSVSFPSSVGTYGVTLSGGTTGNITAYTISNGGLGWISNTEQIVYVFLTGNQNGTSDQPCNSMPTGLTATLNGSGTITAITGTGGTGCSGNIYVHVVPVSNIAVGILDWASDSTLDDAQPGSTIIGIQQNSGNSTYKHAHPTGTVIGFQNAAVNTTIKDTEVDTNFKWGFDFMGGSGVGTSVSGTNEFGDTSINFNMYHLASNATVQFGEQGNLNEAVTSPVDYHEFLMPYGTFETAGYLPAGSSVCPNDTVGSNLGCILEQPVTVGSSTTPQTLTINGTLQANNTANINALNVTGSGAFPTASVSIGGSTYNPLGNILTITGDWDYGTNVSLINSQNGTDWQLIAGGNGSAIPGALAFNNSTNQPFYIVESGSAAPTLLTLSNAEMAFSTSSGVPTSTAQNAGMSSSGSGVIDLDSTTVGNHAAKVLAAAYVASGTTFTASGCGTVTSLLGGATAGSFHAAATSCTVVVTMGSSVTAPNGFACSRPNDLTTNSDSSTWSQTATSTTTATLSGTAVSGDVINFACTPY